ncbi:uncharacterized protein LOC100186516 isoform X2 [Ciona intestinalis]
MDPRNNNCGDGDSLVSGRFEEKAQLQSLNQRFSNYVLAVRSRREQEEKANHGDESRWSEHLDQVRGLYEQQMNDLRAELEERNRRMNEMEASRTKYETASSEFERRVLSLNETVLNQNDEITKLQANLSNKEFELQQVQLQLTGPRTELETYKAEKSDLSKRLAESERRCMMEEKAKMDIQNELTNLHTRCSHELLVYQQEINNLNDRLERSRQLTLELEETARRSGRKDGEVSEMMRKAREASEMELRRYMQEAEAKHHLSISEIKMHMDADARNMDALVEENGRLRSDFNNISTELEGMRSKLDAANSSIKVAQNNLESERKRFESQLHTLNRKLQETQDMLLIKIKELTASEESNIPLKAEIDFLRNLIEEEENRLGLENNAYSALKNGYGNTGANNQSGNTGNMSTFISVDQNKNQISMNRPGSASLHGGKMQQMTSSSYPRRPSSVPIATRGFIRGSPGSKGSELFKAPLADSKFNNYQGNRNSSPASYTSSLLDIKSENGEDEENERERARGGMEQLPPRPENPIPPKKLPRRPASAANARYISADAGQGKDYFDSMFQDLKKGIFMNGHDTGEPSRVTSTYHDMVNSTASATGSMKLVQVDENGDFVRVHNTSATKEEEIGGFLLQQNVAGHPVAVFRFPPRTRLQPGHSATVWSNNSLNGAHDPPTHYLWKQLDKWGTGPECTTILCRPNGQAIAWMTSAPRISRVSRAYQHQPDVRKQTREVERLVSNLQLREQNTDKPEDKEEDYGSIALPIPSTYTTSPVLYTTNPPTQHPVPVIKREKSAPASLQRGLLPTRTGSAPLCKYTAPPSPLHHKSQVSRSTIAQTPQPIPLSPPNTPQTQTTIQSPRNNPQTTPTLLQSPRNNNQNTTTLQSPRNHPQNTPQTYLKPAIKHSPTQASNAGPQSVFPGSTRLQLPGTFLPPHEQHRRGLSTLQSNHNPSFLPPMPRTYPPVTPLYTKRGEKCDIIISR